ncbi:class I SAM-dependent methyltransferase, partial [Odoribacter sp. OttesenSCG-928-L07]|nr:class I SAM-dependent methyltransferase [Odoribacter sp. OttesenSCG-928-L07]
LASKYPKVIALDLEKPETNLANVEAMKGDIVNLELEDNTVDLVVCTEVIEHIKPELLQQACNELIRVSKKYILIGVPYKQDLKTNATYCINCNTINPTTGHLNVFDEEKLTKLFSKCKKVDSELIGRGQYLTNKFSYNIFKRFKFPYGSYSQEEGCVNCGNSLIKPKINPISKLICIAAQGICYIHNNLFINKDKHPLWIHILFEKIED